jgi:Uma2 family endonuclease
MAANLQLRIEEMKIAEALQMPEGDAEIWPLSVEAYHVLGEAGLVPKRTELLYGFVYQKIAKSALRSSLVQLLQEQLRAATTAEFLVRTEQPITCADSEPEPDLAVVRGKIGDIRLAHPRTAELVIEVCVTSADYDRSKLRAYARAAVKECWLILGPERRVEVHRSPVGDKFIEPSVHGPTGRLQSRALPAFAVDLTELFAL